jgi:hypothetical protein
LIPENGRTPLLCNVDVGRSSSRVPLFRSRKRDLFDAVATISVKVCDLGVILTLTSAEVIHVTFVALEMASVSQIECVVDVVI